MKIITMKYAGVCKDCGTDLEAGTKAKWYGRGRIYGLDCHENPNKPKETTEADHTRAYVEAQAEAEGTFKYEVLH